MAMLVFYWSIMIVCCLLAVRLRRYADRFGFLNCILSVSVFVLVFTMGLRMGADRKVTSRLGTIGIQAVLVTVLVIAGSMLGVLLARRLLHIDRHALPADSQRHRNEPGGTPATDSAAIRSSLSIFAMVVGGMLCGWLFVPRLFADLDCFQSVSGGCQTVALCVLLALVGFNLGLEGRLRAMLRGAGPCVLLAPVFSALGALLGGAVYSLLSPVTLREGLAISAGFGWYSMAPTVITAAGHDVAGAISFLHNILREACGIILLPLAAAKIGYIEAAAMPGTAAMDVCLPIVERTCNPETVPYSFALGISSGLFSALLVPLIIGV